MHENLARGCVLDVSADYVRETLGLMHRLRFPFARSRYLAGVVP